MSKHCSKCGTENPDNAFWCINCNTKLMSNISPVQKGSQPEKTVKVQDEQEEIQWEKELLAIENQKIYLKKDFSILKIPLMIFLILGILFASWFFLLNINVGTGDDFNWEHYGFPWENDEVPWGGDRSPTDGFMLPEIGDDLSWVGEFHSEESEEFVDVYKINEDYWFEGNTINTKHGWIFTISRLADCNFEGIVLSTHVYHNTGSNSVVDIISPIDIFMGFGDVASNFEEYPYIITKWGNRIVYCQSLGSGGGHYFMTHLTNTHIIPHNEGVFNKLSQINVGDVITIKGSYVCINGENPSMRTKFLYSWESDTVVGNSHCEIILVDSITING